VDEARISDYAHSATAEAAALIQMAKDEELARQLQVSSAAAPVCLHARALNRVQDEEDLDLGLPPPPPPPPARGAADDRDHAFARAPATTYGSARHSMDDVSWLWALQGLRASVLSRIHVCAGR
jgi:hypothetical protein